MITFNTKERLEQEISLIITLITSGRLKFFEITGNNLESGDQYYNHWETKDIFEKDLLLSQTDLNVQLLYIKLNAYYELFPKSKKNLVTNKPRQMFAHAFNGSVIGSGTRYNYFLHKVANNFSKFCYLVIPEKNTESSKTIDLDLDREINHFCELWKNESALILSDSKTF